MRTVYTQSTNWCFTINNPTDNDYLLLNEYGATQAKYLIFSDEVGSNGTPHIQGYVVLPKRLRTSSVSKLFPRAHLEASKGTAQQASDYCRGGGSTGKPPSANVVVYGTISNVPGKTNLYESFRDWVLEQPTKPSAALVAYKYPSLFLRNGRTQTFIDAIYPQEVVPSPAYRDYQQRLVDRLSEPACTRKVIFVVDPAGNSGKSWFSNVYYRSNPLSTQILSVGRIEDVTYAIDITKSVFFFDVPRSRMEHFQYSVVEQLKDSRIFVTKYESRVNWLLYVPHVVVMCNEYPDMLKLSKDRYEIIVWNHEVVN